jgi:hypothetical protein
LRQEPSRFRGDAALTPDEFIDALNGNAKMLRKGNLCLTKGHEKLFSKDLARMGRNAVLRLHGYPLW